MRALAVSTTAVMFCSLTSAAFAGADVYCDAYARDFASRKTGQEADMLAGTIGGAAGGALIGGIIGKGNGAAKGAVIGAVGGTLIGAAATDEKWHRSYDKVFAACMDSYEPQDVEAIADPVPARKSAKPRTGIKQWANYCASRYRSYDARTGKYKSYSGEMRTCR